MSFSGAVYGLPHATGPLPSIPKALGCSRLQRPWSPGRLNYLQALQSASATEADRLMRDACRALITFQQHVPAMALPPFNEALLAQELALFPDWCVALRYRPLGPLLALLEPLAEQPLRTDYTF